MLIEKHKSMAWEVGRIRKRLVQVLGMPGNDQYHFRVNLLIIPEKIDILTLKKMFGYKIGIFRMHGTTDGSKTTLEAGEFMEVTICKGDIEDGKTI